MTTAELIELETAYENIYLREREEYDKDEDNACFEREFFDYADAFAEYASEYE